MGKGNEKEEYADWSEEERTVHRLRDGLREVVAEGSFGAGALKGRDRRSRVLRVKESGGMCGTHI